MIGHSGCGKSTLLNIVAGLVSTGAVILDGDGGNPGRPGGGVQEPLAAAWLTV